MAAWMMLSWELVGRFRFAFGLTVAYLVALSVIFPFLPDFARQPQYAALLTGLPLIMLTSLIAIASHGNHGELEARASAFPSRLFLLPVHSAVLVSAPLVLGSLITLLGWAMAAYGVMRPCGAPVRLWPGALAAAMLAWCQALSWMPFPLRWSRMVVLCLVIWTLGAGAIGLGEVCGDPVLIPLYLTLTAIAYVVAWAGVRLARHGVGVSEPAAQPVAGAVVRSRPAFRSPEAAQFWLEVRLRGWLFLLSLATAIFCTLPAVHMVSMLYSRPFIVEALGMTRAVETLGIGWLSIAPLAMMPVVMSLFSGTDLGKMGTRREKSPIFLLTLPISTDAIVRIKRQTAALGVALLWLALVVVAAAWAAATGHLGDMATRLVDATGSVPAALAAFVGALTLVIAVSWWWLVSGMWAGLMNHPLTEGVPAGVGLLVATVAVCAAQVWVRYPDWRWLVTAGVVVLLILKAAFAAWVMRRLLSERLAQPLTLAAWLIGWLGLSLMVAWLVCWQTGAGATEFAAVVALMPLASVLDAPLALHGGRHR